VGSRWRAAALVGLGLVGIMLGAALVGAWLVFGEGDCRHLQLGRSTSPDGKWTALAFQRDCGGAVGKVTVNVLITSDPRADPRGQGNVFAAVSTSSHPGVVYAAITWEAPGRLRIEYDGNIHVMEERSSYRGVEIAYKRSLY